MWISFTDQESVRYRRKHLTSGRVTATLLWVAFAAFSAALLGWGERRQQGWVGWPEFCSRFELRLLVGGLVIWCLPWAWWLRRQHSWGCQRCGSPSTRKASQCQCGAPIIDVTNMRWVDEASDTKAEPNTSPNSGPVPPVDISSDMKGPPSMS
jgi:hypothetical protein